MQDVKAATWNKRQNARRDLVGIVSPDFHPALDAKRLPAARKKQPQIIVNLRGSRNSRTRAPRTQIDSCSGRTSVVAWVISSVAKNKLRQRVLNALPKLQIIRLLSKRGKLLLC